MQVSSELDIAPNNKFLNQNNSSSSKKLNPINNDGPLNRIVLKFTTISEQGAEAPSFYVGKEGADIGRSIENEVCVPSDLKLVDKAHAKIFYDKKNGTFNLIDCGYDYGASIRIAAERLELDASSSSSAAAAPPPPSSGPSSSSPPTFSESESSEKIVWTLVENTKFSAGNSIFQSNGINNDGQLLLKVLEGPCKGQMFKISPNDGAYIGRSSENTIAIPDRELSRKHSKIVYNSKMRNYYLTDCGSTNGTYIMLCGPYAGPLTLSLNDHILVARTGFSVNRYDYGISEEMGMRQTMEDSCVIVQHLKVEPLCISPITPQSFFGVFDGHGGARAARYLSHHLHVNVATGLRSIANTLLKVVEEEEDEEEYIHLNSSNSSSSSKFNQIVEQMLYQVFMETDKQFVECDKNAAHGSTATTVLLLGNRLFCANVGDSRVLISRNGKPVSLTIDQKPSRPDEAKRIRDAGGFVINNRVMGELAVSRAFGDADFKRSISAALQEEGVPLPTGAIGTDYDQPLITAMPEIQMLTIEPTDDFLVLGCDGLFDVLEPIDIVDFIKEELINHGDVQKCSAALTTQALQKGSRDNVSVIVIALERIN